MTKQEIFDKVCLHLLTQKKKSERLIGDGPTKECMYRSPDGCKCAMGIFISDVEYKETMEGVEIGYFICTGDVCELVNADISFCSELQFVHDKYDVEDWRDQLEWVGRKYSLSLDVLSEFKE